MQCRIAGTWLFENAAMFAISSVFLDAKVSSEAGVAASSEPTVASQDCLQGRGGLGDGEFQEGSLE